MILRISTFMGTAALALALAMPVSGAMAQDRKDGGGQAQGAKSGAPGNQGGNKGGNMGANKPGGSAGPQMKSPSGNAGRTMSTQTNRTERTNWVNRGDGGNRTVGSTVSRGDRDRGDRGDGRHRGRRTSWGGNYVFYFYDGYYHGNCAWLKQRYRETGARYWLRRYQQCRAE